MLSSIKSLFEFIVFINIAHSVIPLCRYIFLVIEYLPVCIYVLLVIEYLPVWIEDLHESFFRFSLFVKYLVILIVEKLTLI